MSKTNKSGPLQTRVEALVESSRVSDRQNFFAQVQTDIISLLQQRGLLPDVTKDLPVNTAEAIVLQIALGGEFHPLLDSGAVLLARLRLTLLGSGDGMLGSYAELLLKAVGGPYEEPQHLIGLGIEVRDFLEAAKSRTTEDKYTDALKFFLDYVRDNLGYYPKADDVFEHLKTAGHYGKREKMIGTDFAKTYRKEWKPKFICVEQVMFQVSGYEAFKKPNGFAIEFS